MNEFPFDVIDLTHALDENIPTWDGSCGFHHRLGHDYDPDAFYKFKTHKIDMSEGIGTHMDAPAHGVQGGLTIDELPLASLIAPCVVLDVSKSAHERFGVSRQDIEAFEKIHGSIKPGSFVMVRTGWDRFWNIPDKYRNNHIFPSIAKEAAEILLDREISGVGIDTLSPDRPEDGFPVHKLMLEAGKYIVENAANLIALPPQGSFILTLPIKIKNGTEAPVRLIGLINKGSHCEQ